MAKSQSTHELSDNRAPSTAAAVVPDQPAGSPVRVTPVQPAGPQGRQGGPAQGRRGQGGPGQAGPGQGAPGQGGQPQQAVQRQIAQSLTRALQLHREGRYREAEPIYRAVLERAPKRVGALINFSSLLRATGRVPQAREIAERAVEAGPGQRAGPFHAGHDPAPAAPRQGSDRILREGGRPRPDHDQGLGQPCRLLGALQPRPLGRGAGKSAGRRAGQPRRPQHQAEERAAGVRLRRLRRNGPSACSMSSSATWTRWASGASWQTSPIAPCSCRCPRRCCCAAPGASTSCTASRWSKRGSCRRCRRPRPPTPRGASASPT